jgi:hypothetical protein
MVIVSVASWFTTRISYGTDALVDSFTLVPPPPADTVPTPSDVTGIEPLARMSSHTGADVGERTKVKARFLMDVVNGAEIVAPPVDMLFVVADFDSPV